MQKEQEKNEITENVATDYGLVSIIMPNYNCEKFIAETLDSVIKQTYKNWELIIVDDCSTDNSVSIIQSYQQNDERIKLFINEKNSGAATSRNKAIKESKGKWIAFLDSDDLWTDDKLKKQIAFMVDNGYHFSYTYYEQIDEQSNLLGVKVVGPKKISKRKMFNYCYPGCLTVIYDADVVGLLQLDERITKRNDYGLWLKASKKAKCYCLKQTLAFYRRRKGSISNQSKTSLIKYHYKLFRISEGMCAIRAAYYTLKNLFYGALKKIFYVKKVKENRK